MFRIRKYKNEAMAPYYSIITQMVGFPIGDITFSLHLCLRKKDAALLGRIFRLLYIHF